VTSELSVNRNLQFVLQVLTTSAPPTVRAHCPSTHTRSGTYSHFSLSSLIQHGQVLLSAAPRQVRLPHRRVPRAARLCHSNGHASYRATSRTLSPHDWTGCEQTNEMFSLPPQVSTRGQVCVVPFIHMPPHSSSRILPRILNIKR
jgi:hypothetical protein